MSRNKRQDHEARRARARDARRARQARAFVELVRNELETNDWMEIEVAVTPLDRADFAGHFRMLDAQQRALAEPAWQDFLAALETSRKDPIEAAFDRLRQVVGVEYRLPIDPVDELDDEDEDDEDDEDHAGDCAMAGLVARLVARWAEGPDEAEAERVPVAARLPLAATAVALEDTAPGAEPLPPLSWPAEHSDWAAAPMDLDLDAADDRDSERSAVRADSAAGAPESEPGPDWQTAYQKLAETVATRSPWPIVSGCLAVVLLVGCVVAVSVYERARGEVRTLREQAAERVHLAPHVLADVMPATHEPVAIEPGQLHQVIIPRKDEPEWKFTIETLPTFERKPEIMVIPSSQKSHTISNGTLVLTVSWSEP